MFITVCGQKGGVAKPCTSIHLASVWHSKGTAWGCDLSKQYVEINSEYTT